MKLLKKQYINFFLLTTCCTTFTWAQSFQTLNSFPNSYCLGLQKRNHEFAYSAQPVGFFFCNPIMLEGVELDYLSFGLESTGKLTLIKGDIKSDEKMVIPFYLHLRRNGGFVNEWWGNGAIFMAVEISAILKAAHNGDELIIEPYNKEDWPAKRIIKIGDRC